MKKLGLILMVSIAIAIIIIVASCIPMRSELSLNANSSNINQPDQALNNAPFECTLIGVTGSYAADNEIFFGQTMDNPWWPVRHTLWVIQPENGYKFIGTKASIWGFWTGMNEKGLGWVGAYVACKDTPNPEGIDRFDIGPMLLGSCANVEEAIKFLQNIPRGEFCPRNALIGDAKGNLALVEISYQSICVETLTTDGYVVRTNHFISSKMKDLDYKPDGYVCERLQRGIEWIEKVKPPYTPIHVEDMFQWFSYIYLTRLLDPVSGPGTACVIQPKKLTYWFTYGWPSGNLPPKDLENRQICQNMTWGVFIPFYLPELPPGQYTTELGQLTPLAIQYLMSHFTPKLQRPPAWYKYQSLDPTKPFYRPPEDTVSPDPYSPRPNPYCPGGFPGTWTPEEGFVPYKKKKP